MGLPVINRDFVQPDGMRLSFSTKPSANLFISVDRDPDGFSFADPAHSARLSLKSSSGAGPSFLSNLVTLFTGKRPASHNIPAPVWIGEGGKTTAAFSEEASSWAMSATLQDMLAQAFPKQAMVVSFSADPQVAHAAGLNRLLDAQIRGSPQATVFYHDADFSLETEGTGSLAEAVTLSRDDLKQILSQADGNVFAYLTRNGETAALSSDRASIQITVDDAKRQRMSSTLRLSDQADLVFLMELQGAFDLVQSLKANSGLRDGVPDFYSFAFVSLKGLEQAHGRDSTQYVVAREMLDRFIPWVMEQFSAMYSQRLLAEVLVSSSAPVEIDRQTTAQIAKVAGVSEDAVASNYPNLYLQLPKQDVERICSNIRQAELPTPHQVHCPTTFSLLDTSRRFKTQAAATAVSKDDIRRYQIVLWFSIGIVLVTLFAIYNIAFMGFKKDSLIYSTFNPNWDDRAGGRKAR